MIRQLLPLIALLPASLVAAEPLADGRFGMALDARRGGGIVTVPEPWSSPLTVDAWVRLFSKSSFNILVASEPKSSPTHWELYTYAGTGRLSVYLPGRGGEVKSDRDLCDGQWHHVAMLLDETRLRLFVDGRQVLDQRLPGTPAKPTTQQLAFGRLVEGGIGCDGLIDELRIARGLRTFDEMPRDRPSAEQTLGVWRFDEVTDGQLANAANPRLAAKWLAAGSAAAKPPQKADHFGQEGVGFAWTENDSRDDRWKEMDVGRFLASVVGTPAGPVRKGLSIRIGERGEATVCYDTEHNQLRAAWTGGFLHFSPARFGLISPPTVGGEIVWLQPERKPATRTEYRGLYRHGERVVLAYRVDGVDVLESPWRESAAFVREFEIAPTDQPLRLSLGEADAIQPGEQTLSATIGKRSLHVAIVGETGVQFDLDVAKQFAVRIPPHVKRLRFKLLFGPEAAVKTSPPPSDLSRLTQPGPPRWSAPIVTRGQLGKPDGPYTLDTLTIPFTNPYRALFFTSGLDFFANGDLAVCTVHGDVWRVRGVDERLERLEWKRFATGLHQPLGLRIVDDRVYVVGRDQITRLHDTNGDGEADFYENFNNAGHTSAGGHDYVGCLETDSAGNFYYVHATQGLMRVSADGSRAEPIATGFRNPNGLGIGPGDVITVSPQEGDWTPGSNICEVRAGGFYGFGGPRAKTPDRPLGYDPPLVWIPRLRDNSSGGQTWVTSDRWGPLGGQLLHFSFGQCRMMLVLRDGRPGVQGATVDFPLTFDSGVMRGRFRPQDGQLYVTGLRGWVSSAVRDGGLQRVRYTGQAVDLPIGFRVWKNGVSLTFTRPLDPVAAEDVENFHLSRWNYRYAASYGSDDWKVSQPNEPGRDEVDVLSATLLDERTVFLELADVRPVNQLEVGYTLRPRDGAPIKQTLHATINAVPNESVEPSRLRRKPRPGRLSAEDESRLRPGLLARFEQPTRRDVRPLRLAALHVPAGTSATSFLEPGPFTARLEGFLRTPLRGEYTFSLHGRGASQLRINGQPVTDQVATVARRWPPQSGDRSYDRTGQVTLHQGFNRFDLSYTSPPEGDATFRLTWSNDAFATETVPPTVLFHAGDAPGLTEANRLHRGRDLFLEFQCGRCHTATNPDRTRTAPSLAEAESRFDSRWLFHWLLDPPRVRNEATMPALFDPADPASRQAAADVAVWLAGKPTDQQVRPTAEEHGGRELYEDLGCLACHRLDAPTEPDDQRRLSLHFTATKFRPAALVAYLREPGRFHPATRMPDFRLSADEANAIVALLRGESAGTLALPDELKAASVERGRTVFVERRCGACHAEPKTEFARVMSPRVIAAGCLAASPATNVPRFPLTAEDRHAILAFLASDPKLLDRRSLAEESTRLTESLRCVACHTRDAKTSPRGMLLAEESERGLPAESLPNLTWTGEKLRTDWTRRFLAGEIAGRPRTWLKARMPAFPAYAEQLAQGLAAEHGIAATSGDETPARPDLVSAGDRLTRKLGGLDCRQCHGVGAEQPSGDRKTQIAQGINFALTRERLRYDFYRRFVLDPPRYDVTTKMPKLSADGRTTKVTEEFDGDAVRQFEAIWQFLQQGGK